MVGEKSGENATKKKAKNSPLLFIITLLLFFSVSLLLPSLPPSVFPFLLPPVAPADLAVADPVLARVEVAVVVAVSVDSFSGGGPRLCRGPLCLCVRRGPLVPVEGLVGRGRLLLGLLGGGELGLVGVFLGALGLFGLGELVCGGGGRGFFGGGALVSSGSKKKIFIVFRFRMLTPPLFLISLNRSSVSLSSSIVVDFPMQLRHETNKDLIRARGDIIANEGARRLGREREREGVGTRRGMEKLRRVVS